MKNIRFTYGPSRFRFVGLEDSDGDWKPFDLDYSDTDVTGPAILRYHDLCLYEAACEREGTRITHGFPPLLKGYSTQVKRWAVHYLSVIGNRLLKGPMADGATIDSWTNLRDFSSSDREARLYAARKAYPESAIAAMSALVDRMDARRTVLTEDVTDLSDLVFAPDRDGLYLFLPIAGMASVDGVYPWRLEYAETYLYSRSGSWTDSCEDPPQTHYYPGSSDTGSGYESYLYGYVRYQGYDKYTHKLHYPAYSSTYSYSDTSACVQEYTESTESTERTLTTGTLTGGSCTLTIPFGEYYSWFAPDEIRSIFDMADVKVIIVVTWPSEYSNTSSVSWDDMYSDHTRYMNGKICAVSVPASIHVDGETGWLSVDVTVSPSVFNGLVERHKFDGEYRRDLNSGRADFGTVEYKNAWMCEMKLLGAAIRYNPRERPAT